MGVIDRLSWAERRRLAEEKRKNEAEEKRKKEEAEKKRKADIEKRRNASTKSATPPPVICVNEASPVVKRKDTPALKVEEELISV